MLEAAFVILKNYNIKMKKGRLQFEKISFINLCINNDQDMRDNAKNNIFA